MAGMLPFPHAIASQKGSFHLSENSSPPPRCGGANPSPLGSARGPAGAAALAAVLSASACTEALYPPRPQQTPGPALADPPTSRVTMHLSLTSSGMSQLIEASVPQRGEVPFTLIGQRKLIWQRTPITLTFDGATGKIGVRATITGEATLPVGSKSFSLTMAAEAQPVLSSDYLAQLRAPNVSITSEDRLLRAAEWGRRRAVRSQGTDRKAACRAAHRSAADARTELPGRWRSRFPSRSAMPRPVVAWAWWRSKPARRCWPGVSKRSRCGHRPSITMPCTNEAGMAQGAKTVPPLHNVSSIPSGPFTVTMPVAATYEELQRAMKQAFTNGKLFFSPEYPDLYLERPEVYASGGQVVTKLHLDGFVKKGLRSRSAATCTWRGIRRCATTSSRSPISNRRSRPKCPAQAQDLARYRWPAAPGAAGDTPRYRGATAGGARQV